jgi:hypothetical protein
MRTGIQKGRTKKGKTKLTEIYNMEKQTAEGDQNNKEIHGASKKTNRPNVNEDRHPKRRTKTGKKTDRDIEHGNTNG